MGARSAVNGSSTRPAHGVLPQERDLPVVVTQRRDAAVVGPVNELLAGPFGLTLERGYQVVAVEVNLVGHVADLLALQQVFLHVWIARRGEQRGQHVFMRADVVDDRAGLDRPASMTRSARGNRLPTAWSSRPGTSWCRRRAR